MSDTPAPETSDPGFAELVAATNYSFLRGASHPAEMVAEAIALGMPGIGIADRNSVAGVVRALTGLRKLGEDAAEQGIELPPLKIVVGARLVFDDDLERWKLDPFFGSILAQLAQPGQRPHHPRDAVAVGDADAGHAERERLGDHVDGVRRAAQEAVVGRGDQLGKGRRPAHANTPWIYQSGRSFSS